MAATAPDTESMFDEGTQEKKRRGKAVKPLPFTRKCQNVPRVPIDSHGNSLARLGPYLQRRLEK